MTNVDIDFYINKWKKENNIKKNNVNKIIKNKLKHGWIKIINNYKKNKNNKKIKNELELFIKFRQWYIPKLFNESKKEVGKYFSTANHTYITPGSKNLTSDLDGTSQGKYSAKILSKMMELHSDTNQDCWGRTLTNSCQTSEEFDNNTYIGMVSFSTIDTERDTYSIHFSKEGKKYWMLYENNNVGIKRQLKWANLKLAYGVKHFNKKFKKNYSYILDNISKKLLHNLKKQYCNNKYLDLEHYLNGANDFMDKWIINKATNISDDGNSVTITKMKKNIFDNAALVRWYSTEAYYSLFPIIHVVLGMQTGKQDVNLTFLPKNFTREHKREIYKGSAIENFGFLLYHIENNKISFIENSKYFYRTYDALFRYFNNDKDLIDNIDKKEMKLFDKRTKNINILKEISFLKNIIFKLIEGENKDKPLKNKLKYYKYLVENVRVKLGGKRQIRTRRNKRNRKNRRNKRNRTKKLRR